jgi:hypothetical protein
MPKAKKNEECRLEEQIELKGLLGKLRAERNRGQIDLEAWEEAICTAVLQAGARLLETLLEGAGRGRRKEPVFDADGNRMQSLGLREKILTSVLGEVRLRRSVFRTVGGAQTRAPLDELLGVEGTSFSPGVRRLMARAGSRTSFQDASADLALYAHLQVTPKQVQRVAEETGRRIEAWVGAEARQAPPADPKILQRQDGPPILYVSFDGTGIPMRKAELASLKGKAKDGSARTREVKLGCVFTQTTLDEAGRPVRDPDSTSYVGAIESSEIFGLRIYQEALRRGCEQAGKLVVLSDGAKYNKSIVAMHFPEATHIIDLYHAREHLHEISRGLALAPSLAKQWIGLLDMGRIQDLVAEVRRELQQRALSAEETKAWQGKLPYFESNAAAMRYADFRRQGYFVGSGVVEAGCRTVIGQRLKHSGMFWSLSGANAIIASRCCQLSNRFEDFWEATA